MFCMNCGKPTEGDQVLCPECAAQQAAQQAPAEQPAAPAEQPAAPMEQPAPQQPVWQEAPQQPVWQEPMAQPAPVQDTFVLNTPETTGPKKKKNNKLVTAIIAAVTAVAVLVGGIAGWPYIANFFSKTFSSPEKYNANTVTDTVADKDGVLISTYSSLRNYLASGAATEAAAEGTLRLQISEELLSALLYAADVDAEELAFLKDISVKMDVNTKDGTFEIAATPVLGKTEIVTLELGMDMQEGVMWFRLPELSKEYVIADFDDMGMDMDYAQIESSTLIMAQLAQVLPEEEVLIRLLEKYIPLAMAEIEDVEKESETLEAGGLKQSVTAITSTIDYETMLNMAIAVLEEVEDDEDIEDICDSIDEFVEEANGYDPNMHDSLTEAIPYALESLKESKEYADEQEGEIELVTYVDNKGDVVGLDLGFDGAAIIEAYTVRKGDDFAFVLEVPQGDLELTGEGTDKKGIVDATYKLEVSGETMLTVKLKDFDSNGLTKGTILLQPSEMLMEELLGSSGMPSSLVDDLALELSFASGEKESSVSVAIVSGSKDMVRLSLDSAPKKPSSVKAPSDGIDMSNSSAEEWVEGWDTDAVLGNLREAGVPDELVAVLESALEDAFTDDYYDDYYGAYTDDYDYDYDYDYSF